MCFDRRFAGTWANDAELALRPPREEAEAAAQEAAAAAAAAGKPLALASLRAVPCVAVARAIYTRMLNDFPRNKGRV